MHHHIMARFWWILALRGALGILLGLTACAWLLNLNGMNVDLFGLSAFLRPAALLATVILLLGLYAFIDGLFALLLGVQDYGEGRRWWSLIIEGLVSVSLGLLTWFKPESTVLILLYLVAGWALLTGVLEILQALDLNEYKERRGPLYFAGICSMVFGISVFSFRVGGDLLVWLVSLYAFAFGIALLVLAFRLRHFRKLFPHKKG